MARKQKILIFLAAIFLILALYLVLTSESVEQTVQTVKPMPNGNQAALAENYQAKAKPIFSAYETLLNQNNFTAEDLIEFKNKLLDLKVPAKFKELHIQLILALTKMENYLNQKKQQEKIDSLQMTNQLKANYSWLNN